MRIRRRSPAPSTPGHRPRLPAPPPTPLITDGLDDDAFVRLAFQFLLDRAPSAEEAARCARRLADGSADRATILDELRFGPERRRRIAPAELLISLHLSRCDFVRSFVPAARILDLGGTHQSDPSGAMVSMGYPYRFEELVIVDLPHEERHDLYTHSAPIAEHDSPLGPVRYRYHSMTDLSPYPDASFDLVYSGQTIEHVTPAECDVVLAEVARVLRPGGWFYVDTPNGPVCRLQQAEFINPDHEVEYGHEEFVAKLEAAGFDVPQQYGLNWAGPSVETGQFDLAAVAAASGVYGDPARCYLLAYGARKP